MLTVAPAGGSSETEGPCTPPLIAKVKHQRSRWLSSRMLCINRAGALPAMVTAVVSLKLAASDHQIIKNYKWPAGAPHSTEYAVTVNGVAVDVLEHQGFSWLSFSADFTKKIMVEVRPLMLRGVPLSTAVVRPLRHRVQPTLANNVVSFELTRPAKLSVEVELSAASLFANPSNHLPTCAEGASHPTNRLSCPGAGAGVTSDECAKLGCCFLASPNPDPHFYPWCFKGSDAPPPAERAPLFVFAEPLEQNPPQPGAEGVIYFPSGVHDPNPNVTEPWCPLTKAKPMLYLAPGACVCFS